MKQYYQERLRQSVTSLLITSKQREDLNVKDRIGNRDGGGGDGGGGGFEIEVV